nr:putative reverse transcriptase domain-containing protein [Tanacetum cinerariifolium]
NRCPKKVKKKEVREAHGQAYVIKDAEPQGPNVERDVDIRKRGCHLFLAHVTESKSKEKQMEDVPVIYDFPEVIPEELPGLASPWQVEF